MFSARRNYTVQRRHFVFAAVTAKITVEIRLLFSDNKSPVGALRKPITPTFSTLNANGKLGDPDTNTRVSGFDKEPRRTRDDFDLRHQPQRGEIRQIVILLLGSL